MSSKSSMRSGRGRGRGRSSGKSVSAQNNGESGGLFVSFEVVLVIVLLVVAIVLIVFLNRKFNNYKENLIIDESALKRMERFQNGSSTEDEDKNKIELVKKLHVFYAEWCGHSRRYLSTVHPLLEERMNAEDKADFMVAHDVESESGAAAASLVKVTTLPSFYIETYRPIIPEDQRNPNRFRKITLNQPTPQSKVDFLMSQL